MFGSRRSVSLKRIVPAASCLRRYACMTRSRGEQDHNAAGFGSVSALSRRLNFRATNTCFTLFEMIATLALVSLLLSVALPHLRFFVSGRTTIEEARRVVSLTRHAAEEAAARGDAIEFWLDTETLTYGLRSATGRTLDAPGKRSYTIAPNLAMEIPDARGTEIHVFTTVWFPGGACETDALETVRLYNRRVENDVQTLSLNTELARYTIDDGADL